MPFRGPFPPDAISESEIPRAAHMPQKAVKRPLQDVCRTQPHAGHSLLTQAPREQMHRQAPSKQRGTSWHMSKAGRQHHAPGSPSARSSHGSKHVVGLQDALCCPSLLQKGLLNPPALSPSCPHWHLPGTPLPVVVALPGTDPAHCWHQRQALGPASLPPTAGSSRQAGHQHSSSAAKRLLHTPLRFQLEQSPSTAPLHSGLAARDGNTGSSTFTEHPHSRKQRAVETPNMSPLPLLQQSTLLAGGAEALSSNQLGSARPDLVCWA